MAPGLEQIDDRRFHRKSGVISSYRDAHLPGLTFVTY
jgi:hypothetical protein